MQTTHKQIETSNTPYKVECVLPEDVRDVWPQVGLMLSDALARSGTNYTLGEVRQELETQQCMLWVMVDDRDDIIAALVAYVSERRNTLVVWLTAGLHFEEWIKEVESLLQRYVNEYGLKAVEAWVRPGLSRKLGKRGWKLSQVLVRLQDG